MSNTGNLIVLGIFIMIVILMGGFFGWLDLTPQVTIQPSGDKPIVQPFDWTWVIVGIIAIPVAIFMLSGIRIVRQTHRAVIETFGKYSRFMKAGITWVIPVVQKLHQINVTEQLVDVQKQDVITKENLNAIVDAQVYYRVGDSEAQLKNAFYNVDNVNLQMVQLAKSTLRAVIGKKMFKDVNSNRHELNALIFETLEKETKDWGITIVRVELKEIEPPNDVQATMNAIIKAENIRDEAKDLATANETKAKGEKLARIQNAIGYKTEQELRAKGEANAIKAVADGNKYEIEQIAKADADRIKKIADARAEEIKVVNQSANANFIENAKDLKSLEVTQESLKNNTKVIVTEKGISPNLIIDAVDDDKIKKIIPFPSDRRSKESRERDTSSKGGGTKN